MSDYDGETWIEWFCGQVGNEYLCEVDSAFIEDAFNLYGLRSMVPHFRECLDMILDCASGSEREEWTGTLYEHCRDLYGLVQARFILTARGMSLMLAKFEEHEFGRCPNVPCEGFPLLPVGLSNELGVAPVKVFCPKCQNMYHCTGESPSRLDGAYFGTTFPHLLLLAKPQLRPQFGPEPYIPRIYGFRVLGCRGSLSSDILPEIERREALLEEEAQRQRAELHAMHGADVGTDVGTGAGAAAGAVVAASSGAAVQQGAGASGDKAKGSSARQAGAGAGAGVVVASTSIDGSDLAWSGVGGAKWGIAGGGASVPGELPGAVPPSVTAVAPGVTSAPTASSSSAAAAGAGGKQQKGQQDGPGKRRSKGGSGRSVGSGGGVNGSRSGAAASDGGGRSSSTGRASKRRRADGH